MSLDDRIKLAEAAIDETTITYQEWIKRVSMGYKGKPYAYETTAWHRTFMAAAPTKNAWLELLDAAKTDEPVPPLPGPEPEPTQNPCALYRYGNSFFEGDYARYGERYRFVIVGYGDNGAQVAPAKLLDYRTSFETSAHGSVAATSLAGVTHAEAVEGGWALKNYDGGYVFDPAWGTYYGDIGAPGYQARWNANMKARLDQFKLGGLMLDNISGSRSLFGPSVVASPRWASDAAFQTDYLAFLRAMRAALPGYYLLANCGPAADRLDWWRKVAATGMDGLSIETYDGSAAHNALIVAAQDAGRDAHVLVYGDPAGAQVRALAESFNSVTNGGGTFAVNSGGAEPWHTNWTSVLA